MGTPTLETLRNYTLPGLDFVLTEGTFADWRTGDVNPPTVPYLMFVEPELSALLVTETPSGLLMEWWGSESVVYSKHGERLWERWEPSNETEALELMRQWCRENE